MDKINVTKPFFPPIEDFLPFLYAIWQREWLTNHGPLVLELESKLCEYLGVPYLHYLNNGTIALQIAIKALDLKGEVITTPFSYVATTSALVWENCTPVFVDIDPLTFNIDPSKIESSITTATTGILATHVFGNPCAIEAIQDIANRYGLKVIYDAAHCFGTTYKEKSVFCYGNISTTSFHATKLFHTAEGGAVFTADRSLHSKMGYLRNFGHETPVSFSMVGINAKSSELHAAMGLCVLPYMDGILERRKELYQYYNEKIDRFNLQRQKIQDHTGYNYSYYPVVFDDVEQLEYSIKTLQEEQIYPRRYFYPSLDMLPYVNAAKCPISNSIASRILCLPIFHDLTFEQIDSIASILEKSFISR